MPELLALATGRPSPAEKLALLKTIQQGLQERGEGLGEDLRRAAPELAGSMLASKTPEETGPGHRGRPRLPVPRCAARAEGDRRPQGHDGHTAASKPCKASWSSTRQGPGRYWPGCSATSSALDELRENAAMLLANQEIGEARAAHCRGSTHRAGAAPGHPGRAPGTQKGRRGGPTDGHRGRQGLGTAAPGSPDHHRPGELGYSPRL